MNDLQEFFKSVAVEKNKVSEEQARIHAREQRLEPQVKVELNDLSDFFGTLANTKRNLAPKTIMDSVTPAKPEQSLDWCQSHQLWKVGWYNLCRFVAKNGRA